MGRVWRKVKSRSGASLLFAILVFMLCVLAGTAALTAAAANSGRYTHLRGEQQMYLAVNSAAKLMEKQLVGKSFTATKETTSSGTTYTDGTVGSDILDDLLNNYFNGLIKGTPPLPDDHKTYTIELNTDSDPESDIPPVTAAVTAGADYRVEIVLSVKTSSSEYYKTSVTLIPTVTTTPPVVDAAAGTTTETITVTWEEDNVTVRQVED